MDLLVVEDDTVIREGISEFLSEYGYHVIEARDGKEALDLFASFYLTQRSNLFC